MIGIEKDISTCIASVSRPRIVISLKLLSARIEKQPNSVMEVAYYNVQTYFPIEYIYNLNTIIDRDI